MGLTTIFIVIGKVLCGNCFLDAPEIIYHGRNEMKKTILIVSSFVMMFFCSSVVVASDSLDGKIGAAYGSDADKFGLQLNFAFLTEVDPYFSLGFEPGFYWLQWDNKIGRKQQGAVTADVKADTNAYIFPLILDAQILLPDLREKYFILPYLTIGLGYSLMIYDYNQPAYIDSATLETQDSRSDTDFYSGFTWQVIAGAAIKPGQRSRIEFIAEVGYRGVKLKRDNLEIDMSGFLINIGVRYPLTEGSSN